MSWAARIWLFAILVVAALFFPTPLKLAMILCALVLLTLVLYRLQKLPASLTQFIDGLVYKNRSQAAHAPSLSPKQPRGREGEPEAQPASRELFRLFKRQEFTQEFSQAVFQQHALSRSIADEIQSYLSKQNPAKPLSVLICGGSSSGKTKLLNTMPELLRVALSNEIPVAPVHISGSEQKNIDYSELKPRKHSSTVHLLTIDNIDRLSAAGLAELDGVLADSSKAGLLIFATTKLGAEEQSEPRQALSNKLSPSIASRFDAVLTFEPLELAEKADVIHQLIQAMIHDEYGIKLVDNEEEQLDQLAAHAALAWEQAGEAGFHSAWSKVTQGCRESLNYAREKDWQSITISHFDPEKLKITVSAAH